ncbi:ArsR/SmtB family transcription factor [Massilia sp. CMS3.1]|uniref:ArsR/SmtB family transcription factor n=1 Tax=Massilia sp. CMS3.1 TaxID=3373083 RepID=UPI003EE59A9C
MSTANSAPGPAAGLADVFAALGDPTRLQLVTLLCGSGLLSIAQLTASTAISRQGVTKHLQVLADAGLVHDLKFGRERRWQLAPERIDAARHALDAIGRQWEAALGRLKTYVESGDPELSA